jgi:type IV pilus assembly protein PilV
MRPCPRVRARRQVGFTMIEVLVSLLVFSVGVLALVGLQGQAVRFASDAQDRATATFLADQLFARMLISDKTTLASFAHNPVGTTKCAPTAAASTNALVTEWLAEVSQSLPNAASTSQQIIVDTATNQVTVKLCWQNGESSLVSDQNHQLVVSNQVQWP